MQLIEDREVEVASWMEFLDLQGLDGVLKVELRLHCRFDFEGGSDEDAPEGYWLVQNYEGFLPELFPMRLIEGNRHLDKVVRINRRLGKVWVFFQGRLTIKQDMDYLLFPMDKQVMQIELRSNNCTMIPWSGDEHLLGFVGKHIPDIKIEDPNKAKSSGKRLKQMFKGAAHIRKYFSTTARKADAVPLVVASGSPRDWNLEGLHYVLEPVGNPGESAYCSSLHVFILVRRVATSHFFNYFLSMYLIIITLHLGIFIDPDELIARNAAVSSLLLLIIANRFRFTADVPHVNYMTFMDWYLFMSFCIPLAGFCLNVSLTEFDFEDLDEAKRADDINLRFHVSLFTFWSSFHVFLALYIWGRERHFLFVDWIERAFACILGIARAPVPFSQRHHVEAVGAINVSQHQEKAKKKSYLEPITKILNH